MQIKKIRPFCRLFGKYKYVITIVVGIAIIFFIDENSYLRQWDYNTQISDLQSEMEVLKTRIERDSIALYELQHDPSAIKKVAREQYMMKADNEDIFVLSDDKKLLEEKNATVK